MNKSISKKLFTITFGLIIVVIFSSVLFQVMFFEQYYLKHKTRDLGNEVNKFKEMYSFQIYSDETLNSALARYEQENNSRIAIFSVNGDLSYLSDYRKGIDDLQTLTQFCSELLNNKELIYDVLSSGKTKSTVFENKSSGLKKIGIISPMSLKYKNDSIIISVSSIQPIQEAALVIKDFYKYLAIGFIIIGIILSSIYANLITKPLLKINKVAKKMSSMDFSAKCTVNSDDEIGNLGKTLNFLSSNLNSALEDLKQKNLQLEKDIEKERKLETLRKDFVAGVSHELKTPIGIIAGYAEGLKDGVATGENALIYLDTIIDESKKMSQLVSNMLELSRLESDTIELNFEEFNIIRLIQKTIKKLSLDFNSKSIEVIFNNKLEYAYVLGDVFQLEHVITNLLTNAFKYSPNNERVIISIIEDTEKNKYFISIENTGCHIPEDELENIYTKFYRLDKSRNRSDNSNGLGLAIVKRILLNHKSEYFIKNTDFGVKFSFSLDKAKDIL
ncbi:HAMP domain-containing sensor histidine kinase [Clostridium chauvoei]|nr:ATP-binding protein [Clostridium chauvoei]ATD56229.1 two-component sensor histidine kinase [Clostridium chauvoei]ATD58673.1 two-component sensor histidine kinase [Clostridium chauvoei]MBX7280816.1 HAMP domain-containing protein [Clostridium chauvoei]MBX7283299.1 HAMP domain-containing protein [Clostridium chauvoei]MBX7285773.1 HAMP domain-containing protein [Clostridium chauvoei]